MSDNIVNIVIVVAVAALAVAFAINSTTEYWTGFAQAIGTAILIVLVPLAIAAAAYLLLRGRK